MEHALLTLMLLCSPFEYTAESGFVIQHNCNPVNTRFVDETFTKVMRGQPDWIAEYGPKIARIDVATYYVERPCNPTVLYAVLPAANGYVIVLHPDIFKNLDEASLGRAFRVYADILQWRQAPNAGELYGCLN